MSNQKPEIEFFKVYPAEVIAGQKILINWKVTNATTVYFNGRLVAAEGETEKVVFNNTQFKLQAETKGIIKKFLTAEGKVVLAKPVINNFKLEPEFISENIPGKCSFSITNAAIWNLKAEYFNISIPGETLAEGENTEFLKTAEIALPVILKGPCKLILTVFNSIHELRSPPYIFTTKKPKIIDFSTEKKTVPCGAVARLSWKTENAKKIILDPGNYNVTDRSEFEFTIIEKKDISLKLTVYGDFGEKESSEKIIRVAWLGEVTTSNNNFPESPEFYISWRGAHVENVRLDPGNREASAIENDFPIEQSGYEMFYTLSGTTEDEDKVIFPFTLLPAKIESFEIERGSVIIGTRTQVKWKTTNVKKIELNHGIGEKTGQSETSFTALAGMKEIILTAWGQTNLVTHAIPVNLFKGPEINRISISQPKVEIQFKLNTKAFFEEQQRNSSSRHSYNVEKKLAEQVIRKLILPAHLVKNISPRNILMILTRLGSTMRREYLAIAKLNRILIQKKLVKLKRKNSNQ